MGKPIGTSFGANQYCPKQEESGKHKLHIQALQRSKERHPLKQSDQVAKGNQPDGKKQVIGFLPNFKEEVIEKSQE
ncbi:hypothetical protein D3C73_1444970 [compost metagenome]